MMTEIITNLILIITVIIIGSIISAWIAFKYGALKDVEIIEKDERG